MENQLITPKKILFHASFLFPFLSVQYTDQYLSLMHSGAHLGCGLQQWESSHRLPEDTNITREVNQKTKKPQRGGATHNIHQREEVVLDVLFAVEADHGVVYSKQHLDVVVVLSRVSAVPRCILQLLVDAAGNSTYIVKASQIRP